MGCQGGLSARERRAAQQAYLALGLVLLGLSGAFDTNNCTGAVSSQKASPRQEWLHLQDVLLFDGVLHIKAALKWDLHYLTPRRRALGEESPLALPLAYVPSEQQCWCDVVEKRPATVFNFVEFGQYGHTMFDGVSALYATLRETNVTVGREADTLLYMGVHHFYDGRYKRMEEGLSERGELPLGDWQEALGALSKNPPISTQHLLRQSRERTICFRDLTLGMPSTIGHYQTGKGYWNARLLKDFARDLRAGLPVERPFFDQGCQYRVVILNRLHTRRILNVHELGHAVQSVLEEEQVPRHCVDIVATEHMSIAHQVELMHHTRLLVGVDGTGLLNAAFMPPGCGACLHLKPYRQDLVEPGKEGEFLDFCRHVPGAFFSWANTHAASVTFPPHADHKRLGELFATVLAGSEAAVRNASAAHAQAWAMTRLQDMRVDLGEIAEYVRRAVNATRGLACEGAEGAEGAGGGAGAGAGAGAAAAAAGAAAS